MTWIVLVIGAVVGVILWELVRAAVSIVRDMMSGFHVEGDE